MSNFQKTLRKVVLAVVLAGCLALGGCLIPLLQNGDFGSNLSGWTPVNPCDEFSAPGEIEWTAEHDGSAHVTVSGAPSCASLVQGFATKLMEGEDLEIEVYHTDLGDFAGWEIYVDGELKIHNNPAQPHGQLCGDSPAGTDNCVWTADANYPKGTEIELRAAVWPGTAEFYWTAIGVAQDELDEQELSELEDAEQAE